MPPYFDSTHLRSAITARALPALEMLAENPNRLERSLDHRFERDDPPPYMSSSESEEEEALRHPVLMHSRKTALEKFRDLLNQPFTEFERGVVLSDLRQADRPGYRFRSEARLESERLNTFFFSQPHGSRTRASLEGEKGKQRTAVIARRNIRKRWQRLGVWNPEWGIPNRVNSQDKDYIEDWKWNWESEADPPPPQPRPPVARAMQLRENLSVGEHVAPPPRSHLQDDASAAEAESFIISRPWFMFKVELADFEYRESRIPWQQRGRVDSEEEHPVIQWWKERGDWEEDWYVPGDRGRPVVGWKWRHESPSPGPEDLSPLITDEMDFTPSEVDALEAIPPPSPPPDPFAQTFRHWPAPPDYTENNVQNDFPLLAGAGVGLFTRTNPPGLGIVAEEDAALDTAVEPDDQLVLDAEPEPVNPPRRRRGRPRKQAQPAQVEVAVEADDQLLQDAEPEHMDPPPRPRGRPRKQAQPAEEVEAAVEADDQPMQDAEPEPVGPPPHRRGRPRKQDQPAQAVPAPPPRRSARIATMSTKTQAPPASATAQKASTRPARAVPAAPPPRTARSAPEPPKRRGRPRKTQDGGISKPAAPQNRRGRKPSNKTAVAAKAAGLDGQATKDAPVVGKRGRGQPRKT